MKPLLAQCHLCGAMVPLPLVYDPVMIAAVFDTTELELHQEMHRFCTCTWTWGGGLTEQDPECLVHHQAAF